MDTKRIILIGISVAVVGIAYYGISPLFRNVRVDESLPVSGESVADMEGRYEGMPVDTDAREGEILSDRVAIVDTAAHPASGFVKIVKSGDKSYVRYEDLKTINGPDIYVYLSKDLDAKEYTEISRVRATEGNVNYEIPAGVDPRDYPYVLIWCKAFGVLFNSAKVF